MPFLLQTIFMMIFKIIITIVTPTTTTVPLKKCFITSCFLSYSRFIYRKIVYQRKRSSFQNSPKTPQSVNKCAFLPAGHAFIRHFRRAALDTENDIKYNQGSKNRKKEYIEMLASVFQLSLSIRNVWPKRMGIRAFIFLYILLLLAIMPVTLLSCIPYGLLPPPKMSVWV